MDMEVPQDRFQTQLGIARGQKKEGTCKALKASLFGMRLLG